MDDWPDGDLPPSLNRRPNVVGPGMVSRLEWGARAPVADFVEWLPVPYVVVDSSGGEPCYNRQSCCRAVRHLQTVHMDQLGDVDIQYNFLLGQDGMVYEGKGWENKASRKFRGYQNLRHRYIFAFIGRHDLDNPPKILYDKLLDLLRYAKANDYIKYNFQLLDIKDDGSISNYGNVSRSIQARMVRHVDLNGNGYTMIVDRWHWDPVERVVDLPERTQDKPFVTVRFTHTNTRSCYSREDCNMLLREIKEKHLQEGLADIRYNFMVGTSGTVYVGRGWNSYPEYDDANFVCPKGSCLDVAYIGTFPLGMPIVFAIQAGALSLLKHGLLLNHLSPYYNISYVKIDGEEHVPRVPRSHPQTLARANPHPHSYFGGRPFGTPDQSAEPEW